MSARYRMNTRRKLAIATWRAPNDPNIYGKITVNAEPAIEYLGHLRRETGEKVTITHLLGRAAAMALARMPTLNGRIVLGRYKPHETVDISFLVALDDGTDLGKVKIERADQKSVSQIARELGTSAEHLRNGQDAEFEKAKPFLRALPTGLIRPTVWATGWLTGSLGVSVKALGLERYPFGACIVTSVGMFGVDEGYVPPTPFARVPVYVLAGAVRESPAVVGGRLVAQRQVTMTATIDHRFFDGYQGGVLARTIREVFANPAAFDRAAQAPPPARTVQP